MIPKQAIEKAIEGGWKMKGVRQNSLPHIAWQVVALDPTFWQALGKALGWENVIDFEFEDTKLPADYDHRAGQYPEWLYNMHRFIDQLATGGDTEKFWSELIK